MKKIMLLLALLAGLSFGQNERGFPGLFRELTITKWIDASEAYMSVGDLTVIGATSMTGAVTLTGAVDVDGAFTCGSIVSDAGVEATTTLTVGTDATIAGDVIGVDSCGVTDLAVSANAIVDGTVTSVTYNFADATAVAGTADAVTIDFVPDLPTPVLGTEISFKAEANCTGAMTLDIDGAGAAAIIEGSDLSAMDANDVRDTQMVNLQWDGTSWQQTSQSGN